MNSITSVTPVLTDDNFRSEMENDPFLSSLPSDLETETSFQQSVALPAKEDACIRVRCVEKRFGERTVLSDVSFDVRRGEIFAILGMNGAGKTTLANILRGKIAPDTGEIILVPDGAKEPTVSYFPFDIGPLGNLSSRKALIHLATRADLSEHEAVARTEEWLGLVGLRHLGDVQLKNLSRGNQHRILFAIAAMGKPSVLFLDEPCLGLDPISQELFAALVRKLRDAGTTILISDHNLNWVQRLADRFCILHEGRVIEGGTLLAMRRRTGIGTSLFLSLWDGLQMPASELRDRLAHLEIRSVEPLTEQSFRVTLPEDMSADTAIRFVRMLKDVREISVEQPSLHDIYIHTIQCRQGIEAMEA